MLELIENFTIGRCFGQLSWSSWTTVCSICETSLIILSDAPFDWGWKAVDFANLTPSSQCVSVQNCDMNFGSLLLTIVSGSLCSLTISTMNIGASLAAVFVVCSGIVRVTWVNIVLPICSRGCPPLGMALRSPFQSMTKACSVLVVRVVDLVAFGCLFSLLGKLNMSHKMPLCLVPVLSTKRIAMRNLRLCTRPGVQLFCVLGQWLILSVFSPQHLIWVCRLLCVLHWSCDIWFLWLLWRIYGPSGVLLFFEMSCHFLYVFQHNFSGLGIFFPLTFGYLVSTWMVWTSHSWSSLWLWVRSPDLQLFAPGLHFGVFPVVGALHLPWLRVAPQHCTFVVCVSLPLCGECFSPQFILWVGCLHPCPVVDLCWIDLPVLVCCLGFRIF